MSEATIAILVETFGPAVASVVSAVLIWLLGEIARQVRSRTHNEQALNAIDQLTQTAAATVAEIEQLVVPKMKSVAGDGKLSERDIELLRTLAIKKVKERMSPMIKKQATRAVADLDGFIQSKIEQIVYSMKGVCDGSNANR